MKIFVACGAAEEYPNKLKENSNELLEKIYSENHDLVTGAHHIGLMGESYKIAKKYNRKIIGIAPECYASSFANLECDKEIITKTVNDRTEQLINQSDLILFLPGGIGTIYEFFMALEMKRTEEYSNKIIVFNPDNFYDELIEMVYKAVKLGFIEKDRLDSFVVCDNHQDILDILNNVEK